MARKGFIGRQSPGCGNRTSGAERRVISVPAETCSIAIARSSSGTSSVRYPYLMPVIPAAEECLMVPFYVDGKAVGTIWAIMHSDRRKFDSEDERVMRALGQFASLAYQTVDSIQNLKVEIAAREKAKQRCGNGPRARSQSPALDGSKSHWDSHL